MVLAITHLDAGVRVDTYCMDSIRGSPVLLGPIRTVKTHREADHSVKENIEGTGQLETEFSSHHVILTEPSFPIGHAVD